MGGLPAWPCLSSAFCRVVPKPQLFCSHVFLFSSNGQQTGVHLALPRTLSVPTLLTYWIIQEPLPWSQQDDSDSAAIRTRYPCIFRDSLNAWLMLPFCALGHKLITAEIRREGYLCISACCSREMGWTHFWQAVFLSCWLLTLLLT